MAVVEVQMSKPVAPQVESVTLKLGAEEARALHVLTRYVGGDPSNTPRGLIDGIGRQLGKVLGNYGTHPEMRGLQGNLRWNADAVNPFGRDVYGNGDTVSWTSKVTIS